MELHCFRCLQLSAQRHFAIMAGKVLPTITAPHKISERLERQKAKAASKRHQARRIYRGPLIISCKRKEFNHHAGQTYTEILPQHLASGGWKHRKSAGDYFTINSNSSNPSVELPISQVDFASLGINDRLADGLKELGIHHPTTIQSLTIPPMLEGKNVLCAAETGSGKTLAFLLPILEKIFRHKKTFGSVPVPNQPFAIILTPSRELADQIYAVTKDLAPYSHCIPHVICGGRGTQSILRYRQENPAEIVVATPGVLSKLLTNRIYRASRLQHVVLDEADTLLDDSFNSLTVRIIQKLKIASEKLSVDVTQNVSGGTQLALVGATIPTSVEQVLDDVVPVDTIERVTTTHVHRLLPHVPQKFLRLKNSDKPEALLRLLKRTPKRSSPALVFCNKSETATFVHHFLAGHGIQSVLMHSKMAEKVRRGRFEEFQAGACDVLVCTDIASRGLDTIRAEQVINYDFPGFMSDYIHRVGRVGRVGSVGSCLATSLIVHKWDVDLLWKVEVATRKVTQLHNVNANIKRKLEALHQRRTEEAIPLVE